VIELIGETGYLFTRSGGAVDAGEGLNHSPLAGLRFLRHRFERLTQRGGKKREGEPDDHGKVGLFSGG